MGLRTMYLAAALGIAALTGGCASGDAVPGASDAKAGKIPVTIKSTNGSHVFTVEVAKSPEEQERGLMFRTNIPKNEGMIFAPYPAGGGAPREANFWMKNTPSPLDIIFIRPDGTVARIAENTIPFSEDPVKSGEAVSAVLEINGGKAGELGIAPGDKVTWTGQR